MRLSQCNGNSSGDLRFEASRTVSFGHKGRVLEPYLSNGYIVGAKGTLCPGAAIA